MLIKLGFSKTYYRGMGSEFVTDVKNHGLPKGTSITSSKTIAKEYAEKGALNNLEGDPQIGYKTNSKIKNFLLFKNIFNDGNGSNWTIY